MADEKTNNLVCDVVFNEELIQDVNLLKTCVVGKTVEGLWEDKNFYNAALRYLKCNEGKKEETKTANEWPLKSFHGLDRSILRAHVAVRIQPNWKWLEFKDFVADFENKKETLTIGDVLNNVNNRAHKPILRIMPKSEMEADDQEVKTIVQELLTTKSLATLSAAGCPLSKGMMSLIGQDKYSCTISYDKRERFVHWLCRQDQLAEEILVSPVRGALNTSQPNMTPVKIAKSRVTFDPEGEISKLESWFNDNQRPNREVIMEYTQQLNKGRLGKSKRMLLVESVAGWFKNRRARAKKEESASHEDIFPQVATHEYWEFEQEELPATMARKENNSEEVDEKKSDFLEQPTIEPMTTCTATNLEDTATNLEDTATNLEDTATNLEDTATELVDTDSATKPKLAGDEQIVCCNLDQNSFKTADQQIVAGSKKTPDKGHQSANGDLKAGEESLENDDAQTDNLVEASENTVNENTTDSIEKICNNIKDTIDEQSVFMHSVSLVSTKESKTECNLIQSEPVSCASSLKRTRDEVEQVIDHDYTQHCSPGNDRHEEYKKQCI